MFNDHNNQTTTRPPNVIDDTVISDTQFVKSTPLGTQWNWTNFGEMNAKPLKFIKNIFSNS